MAEKLGKKIICDRCGKEVFLAYIGTKPLDGGFTRVNEFESLSDEWTYSHDLQMHLCGVCSRRLKELLEFFKAGD